MKLLFLDSGLSLFRARTIRAGLRRGATALLSACLLAAGASAAPVTSVSIESLSSANQAAVPVTFGQVFKAGDVPSGNTVTLKTAAGQELPTQVDVKTRHPDGSISHAVISTRVASLAPGSAVPVSIEAIPGGAAAGNIVLADLLASTFDATVSFNIGGTSYSANARDLLAKHPIHPWLSGPVVSEWAVGGPVTTAGGVAHPQLAVYLHLRAYGKPVTAVRVDAVIENGVNMVDGASDVTYDSVISVGGATRDSRTLTHYPRARWHQVHWWGQAPQVYVRHDVKYLQASKAFPRFMDLKPSDAYLNSVIQAATPMGNGDLTADMHAPGRQEMIGPLPRWAAVYMVSGDSRAFKYLIAHDSMAGSYGAHWRDTTTRQPVSIVDNPKAEPPKNGASVSPLDTDDAHLPSIGYTSYAVTGDLYYLEEAQFWASYVVLEKSAGNREDAKGIVIGGNWQIRGQAWSLRALAEASFISPDDDPLKGKFASHVRNSLSRFRELYFKDPVPPNDPWANNLHAMRERTPISNGHASWQDDFATWTLSRLHDLGFGSVDVLRYKALFPVARMGEPRYEFCYVKAGGYRPQIGVSEEQPWFDTFREYFEFNYGPLPDACPDGQAFDDSSYPKSPTGYASGQLRIALVAAINAGVPGSLRAWDKFSAAVLVIPPPYAEYPNWALVPDALGVRPKAPSAVIVR